MRRGAPAWLLFGAGLTLLPLQSRSDSLAAVRMPGLLVTGVSQSENSAFEMTEFFPDPRPMVQAVGYTYQRHDDRNTDRFAYLLNPTELPVGVPGVEVLSPGLHRNYGTYDLVELIQQVGARFDLRYPGAALRVGDLSRPGGGTIRNELGRRVHSSHRNGLDVDIMYLRGDCHEEGRFDDPDCSVEVEENLELMRMFVEGGPQESETMVDVIFVGSGFQGRTCKKLAREPELWSRYQHVVSRLQLMSGHRAHFHVRIRCPENSRHCPAPPTTRRELCPNLPARYDQALATAD